MTGLRFALGLALVTGPVWAQDRDEDRFIALVALQDCVITEQEAEAMLPQHGMTIAQTEDFVDAMIDRGDAEFDDGTLTLLPSICPPGDG